MSVPPTNSELLGHLKDLTRIIEQTRQDISAIRPDEMKAHFIPDAKDELDAIVEATASATHKIMDAAECLMDIAGRAVGEDAAKGNAAVMEIFEACTFQDITGQRITKVIKTLQTLQQRLDSLIKSAGGSVSKPSPAPAPVTGDEALLNGPALPGRGHNQSDIDALMASLPGKDA